MKCPLLWKTTIDPVSLASDSIHFCPALALHPGLHLTGADHRLDSLAFFRALPGSRSERWRTSTDFYRWWTDHAELQGSGMTKKATGRPSNDFFGGKDFEDPYFCWRRTRSIWSISWPSHGCIVPAHGMFVCSKINWTMQVSFTRKAETKEGQFRKLEDQEMEIGRSI